MIMARSLPQPEGAASNRTAADDNTVEGLIVKLNTLFDRISENFRSVFN